MSDKGRRKKRGGASRIGEMMRDGTATPIASLNTDYVSDSSNDMMKPSIKNPGAYQDAALSPYKHDRREGLRPRRSNTISTQDIIFGYDNDDPGSSVDQDIEYNDGDDGQKDDGDIGEGQDGRRRYHFRNRNRNRAQVQVGRFSIDQGMGPKVGKDVRECGSSVHKRHRITRTDDSEPDQAQTAGAGPSSEGGVDIQPLQLVDHSVSFEDIGGLSQYIDALKEMVFFPLLYPDFFTSYHITPPRGVLLCGPPGTGKTLIARALASAASKAGRKVSFYMRKGADVLSKWVGEAERQLKLLFEEAQRNQPSIIFFDEIDGLAPVRSSRQEQTHNSIVSTLLALMDGLDSRGQVVLLGATNRVDAIDGALRRPGRFDREFNFPLPGCEARAEILDIHSRKWKHPPSNELKLELAASCVGYCGADLKALCTEAAIRAFREKYPQVYTSDDKFVIDVDSVRVEKYHFVEAMSTITPAAHRGAAVHSRPLSLVVAPCLQRHLQKVMNYISDIFPPIAVSSELTKLSVLSACGSAIPPVYRPRLLLCGGESSGLDHLGPAILHELNQFPVHCLGLASLLSDPSAKTPEEALVHIFGEARRTTPSILYLPQFNLWWDRAHEQLGTVFLTLLQEVPSDLPILLLATSSEVDAITSSIFSERSVYQVAGTPSNEDRCLFFDRLIEAALSVLLEGRTKRSQAELPKAPKVASGPKVSELNAKVESEQRALCLLQMCLRDVCNRILSDERFSAFHYPILDEDAPNYHSVIQNPMDVATLLQRVDSGLYVTCKAFVQDVDLIVSNAKAYNGDDYNGARIVSRAYELGYVVHGMLQSQMGPALIAYFDEIAAQGGLEDVTVVTKASARLREGNLDPSYEAHKRLFVQRTKTYDIPQLERLYARIMKDIFNIKDGDKSDVVPPMHLIFKYLLKFAEDEANF
ncbi:ATPase family AAA domain-containing protein At1g05910-like [Rosa rugosa]|uniref:ATPase family AAA domain-containing protein At1g05910-like n=1 Tax=Rosa rugosa TaxID=74645 RepID=UPI002B410192|nr:ATPase family AAA domain-containing protein At1g05910-like [Rosa rugosa]